MKTFWNEETMYTMEQLLAFAEACIDKRNYTDAQTFLKRAASANNLSAKFRLACLYRDTPELQMPQAKRFALSEQLFLELENNLKKSKDLEMICQELTILYQYKKMPISFIAYKLREYHLNQTPDSYQLSLIENSINRLDLTKLAQDPRGLGVLGLECLIEPHLEIMGVYFLREAVKYGDPQGILALLLADHLEANPSIDEDSGNLASAFRMIAENRGNPDILRRHT